MSAIMFTVLAIVFVVAALAVFAVCARMSDDETQRRQSFGQQWAGNRK